MAQKLGQDLLEKVYETIPSHRLGEREEVAAVAKFLDLDEGANYITGHCFDVDAGVGIAAA